MNRHSQNVQNPSRNDKETRTGSLAPPPPALLRNSLAPFSDTQPWSSSAQTFPRTSVPPPPPKLKPPPWNPEPSMKESWQDSSTSSDDLSLKPWRKVPLDTPAEPVPWSRDVSQRYTAEGSSSERFSGLESGKTWLNDPVSQRSREKHIPERRSRSDAASKPWLPEPSFAQGFRDKESTSERPYRFDTATKPWLKDSSVKSQPDDLSSDTFSRSDDINRKPWLKDPFSRQESSTLGTEVSAKPQLQDTQLFSKEDASRNPRSSTYSRYLSEKDFSLEGYSRSEVAGSKTWRSDPFLREKESSTAMDAEASSKPWLRDTVSREGESSSERFSRVEIASRLKDAAGGSLFRDAAPSEHRPAAKETDSRVRHSSGSPPRSWAKESRSRDVNSLRWGTPERASKIESSKSDQTASSTDNAGADDRWMTEKAPSAFPSSGTRRDKMARSPSLSPPRSSSGRWRSPLSQRLEAVIAKDRQASVNPMTDSANPPSSRMPDYYAKAGPQTGSSHSSASRSNLSFDPNDLPITQFVTNRRAESANNKPPSFDPYGSTRSRNDTRLPTDSIRQDGKMERDVWSMSEQRSVRDVSLSEQRSVRDLSMSDSRRHDQDADSRFEGNNRNRERGVGDQRHTTEDNSRGKGTWDNWEGGPGDDRLRSSAGRRQHDLDDASRTREGRDRDLEERGHQQEVRRSGRYADIYGDHCRNDSRATFGGQKSDQGVDNPFAYDRGMERNARSLDRRPDKLATRPEQGMDTARGQYDPKSVFSDPPSASKSYADKPGPIIEPAARDSRRADLSDAVVSRDPDNMSRCNFCPSPIRVRTDKLSDHVTAEHKRVMFSCAACVAIGGGNTVDHFDLFDDLVYHIHAFHRVTDSETVLETIMLPQARRPASLRGFQCSLKNCERSFFGLDEMVLREHVEQSHGEFYVRLGGGKLLSRYCRICGNQVMDGQPPLLFNSQAELDHHIINCHPDEQFANKFNREEPEPVSNSQNLRGSSGSGQASERKNYEDAQDDAKKASKRLLTEVKQSSLKKKAKMPRKEKSRRSADSSSSEDEEMPGKKTLAKKKVSEGHNTDMSRQQKEFKMIMQEIEDSLSESITKLSRQELKTYFKQIRRTQLDAERALFLYENKEARKRVESNSDSSDDERDNQGPPFYYCLMCFQHVSGGRPWKSHIASTTHNKMKEKMKVAAQKRQGRTDVNVQEFVKTERRLDASPAGQCRDCETVYYSESEADGHAAQGQCSRRPVAGQKTKEKVVEKRKKPAKKAGAQKDKTGEKAKSSKMAANTEPESHYPKYLMNRQLAYFYCNLCLVPVGHIVEWHQHIHTPKHVKIVSKARANIKDFSIAFEYTVSLTINIENNNGFCYVCQQAFKNNHVLVDHFSTVDHQAFQERKEDKDAVLVRIGGVNYPNAYYCDLCEETTLVAPDVHLSSYGHLDMVGSTDPCCFCPRRFGDRHLINHINVEHISNIFHCNLCSIKFISRDLIATHIEKQHGIDTLNDTSIRMPADMRKMICILCKNQVFLSQDLSMAESHFLISHPEVQTDEISKVISYHCRMCPDLEFKNEREMKVHCESHVKGSSSSARSDSGSRRSPLRHAADSRSADRPRNNGKRERKDEGRRRSSSVESIECIKEVKRSRLSGSRSPRRHSPQRSRERRRSRSPATKTLPRKTNVTKSKPNARTRRGRSPRNTSPRGSLSKQDAFGKLVERRRPNNRDKTGNRAITRTSGPPQQSQRGARANRSYRSNISATDVTRSQEQGITERPKIVESSSSSVLASEEKRREKMKNMIQDMLSKSQEDEKKRQEERVQKSAMILNKLKRKKKTENSAAPHQADVSQGNANSTAEESESGAISDDEPVIVDVQASVDLRATLINRGIRKPEPGPNVTLLLDNDSTEKQPAEKPGVFKHPGQFNIQPIAKSGGSTPKSSSKTDVQTVASKPASPAVLTFEDLNKLAVMTILEEKQIRDSVIGLGRPSKSVQCPMCGVEKKIIWELLGHLKASHVAQMFYCLKCHEASLTNKVSHRKHVSLDLNTILMHAVQSHGSSVESAFQSCIRIPDRLERISCLICPPPHVVGFGSSWLSMDLDHARSSINKHFSDVHSIKDQAAIDQKLELCCRCCDTKFTISQVKDWRRHVSVEPGSKSCANAKLNPSAPSESQETEKSEPPPPLIRGKKSTGTSLMKAGKRCDFCCLESGSPEHVKAAHAPEVFQCKICLTADASVFLPMSNMKETMQHMVLKHGNEFESFNEHIVYPVTLYGVVCREEPTCPEEATFLAYSQAVLEDHIKKLHPSKIVEVTEVQDQEKKPDEILIEKTDNSKEVGSTVPAQIVHSESGGKGKSNSDMKKGTSDANGARVNIELELSGQSEESSETPETISSFAAGLLDVVLSRIVTDDEIDSVESTAENVGSAAGSVADGNVESPSTGDSDCGKSLGTIDADEVVKQGSSESAIASSNSATKKSANAEVADSSKASGTGVEGACPTTTIKSGDDCSSQKKAEQSQIVIKPSFNVNIEFICRCCDRAREKFQTQESVTQHIAKRHKQVIKWKTVNGNN